MRMAAVQGLSTPALMAAIARLSLTVCASARPIERLPDRRTSAWSLSERVDVVAQRRSSALLVQLSTELVDDLCVGVDTLA
jgi:hypothetical protein